MWKMESNIRWNMKIKVLYLFTVDDAVLHTQQQYKESKDKERMKWLKWITQGKQSLSRRAFDISINNMIWNRSNIVVVEGHTKTLFNCLLTGQNLIEKPIFQHEIIIIKALRRYRNYSFLFVWISFVCCLKVNSFQYLNYLCNVISTFTETKWWSKVGDNRAIDALPSLMTVPMKRLTHSSRNTLIKTSGKVNSKSLVIEKIGFLKWSKIVCSIFIG